LIMMKGNLSTFGVIAQIAFRNLFASRLKTIIVGGIIFFGAFLVVVGTSFLDSIDQGMSRSIIGSVAGHIQVYSSKSKDELAVMGGFDMEGANLAQLDDFTKVRDTLMAVPNVKAVVPMGINGAIVTVSVPDLIKKDNAGIEREAANQARHLAGTGRRLLQEYANQEAGGPRVVVENDDWIVVVPFWAAWPFETLVLPRRPAARLPDLDDDARDALARGLVELLARYDGLFRRPFPYSMGWHQAPFGADDDGAKGDRADGDPAGWQLHAHFYPPLLRASIRKFMVGYELLAESQRDLTPEDAAARLRAVAIDPTRGLPASPFRPETTRVIR